MERARSAGVENILVDVGVLDLQSTAWSALAIREVKERLGLPCGCAPSNALFSWQKHHRQRLAREDALSATGAAVYSLPINWGADFLFYGPMRCAPWVYPACAVADALVAYGAKLSGTRPRQSTHPLHRI
ncbi:MAG: hypothetical protein H5U02_12665 [Clostridia bacterium]|nr:hypothetical protein [Clostridia bacterium]